MPLGSLLGYPSTYYTPRLGLNTWGVLGIPLHELQLAAAVLGSGLFRELMVAENELAGLDVLDGDLGVVYVDAGARSGRLAPEAFVVKLAVLARRHDGGGVSERVYHPVPLASKDSASPPLFIGFGGERVRQAAGYVIELASLLAIGRSPKRVFGEDFREPLLLVKHGPLLQLISQYFSRPFVVDTDQALSMLLYSGLEKKAAYDLLEHSYLCMGEKKDRNHVVLGLLVLSLLAELAKMARREHNTGVAGVVEDVSRSRLLAAAAAARLLKQALGSRGKPAESIAEVARILRDYAYDYYTRGGSRLVDCLCPGIDLDNLLDSKREWEEFLASARREVSTRFSVSLSSASIEKLEASLLWSGSLPSIADTDFIYLLYYLLDDNYYPATKPLPSNARLELANYYLENSNTVKCHLDEAKPLIEELEAIRYQYLAPVKPPSCSELEQMLQHQKLSGKYLPCELASLYTAPPAIRLEYVEGMKLLEQARALTLYPARITLYGYPPQLLVVDKHSRISLEELAAFHEIVERLAERIKPYTSFIRGWETRISTTV